MVLVVKTVAAVEDVVALVVMVGLVVMVEVALVDEVEVVTTSQILLMALLDVSDLTQNFTDEEWRKFAYNGGWLYVAQA
jgi:hypothetical protein